MPSTYEQQGLERPLRRDARENRTRILVAARAAFAELGIDASVEEIARRAGVGIGTLYRRFPTKDALIDAVFEEHLALVAAAAEHALSALDPQDALVGYLTEVVAMQSADRGLSDILGARLHTQTLVERARTRVRPPVEKLISRAKKAGALRDDVVYEDISVILWTTGHVADATRDVAPAFAQRYLVLLVDGLRSPRPTALPSPPLSTAQHSAALQRFSAQGSRPPRGTR